MPERRGQTLVYRHCPEVPQDRVPLADEQVWSVTATDADGCIQSCAVVEFTKLRAADRSVAMFLWTALEHQPIYVELNRVTQYPNWRAHHLHPEMIL